MRMRIDPSRQHIQPFGIDNALLRARALQAISNLDDRLTRDTDIRFPLIFCGDDSTLDDEKPRWDGFLSGPATW